MGRLVKHIVLEFQKYWVANPGHRVRIRASWTKSRDRLAGMAAHRVWHWVRGPIAARPVAMVTRGSAHRVLGVSVDVYLFTRGSALRVAVV